MARWPDSTIPRKCIKAPQGFDPLAGYGAYKRVEVPMRPILKTRKTNLGSKTVFGVQVRKRLVATVGYLCSVGKRAAEVDAHLSGGCRVHQVS
eukprot:1211919-Heterocapsa_arctica.AAC.1